MAQKIVAKWLPDETEFTQSQGRGSQTADQDETRKKDPCEYFRFLAEIPKVPSPRCKDRMEDQPSDSLKFPLNHLKS